MDIRLQSVCACLCVLLLVAHAPAASAQTESRSVVIAAQNGQYDESARSAPSPGSVQFWTDLEAGTLWRSQLDGSGAIVVAGALDLPYGIAFDDASQALLWTSAGGEVVQKLPVAGGVPDALPTAFEEPYAIDVSTDAMKIVYSSTGNIIYRDTIDNATGEETTTMLLVVADVDPVHGLALDPVEQVLYIGDSNGRMTRRLALKGNSPRQLIYSSTPPTLPAPIPTPTPDPAPSPLPYAVE